MTYSKLAERVDLWMEEHGLVVSIDKRLLIPRSDLDRAAKSLRKPVEEIEAAVIEMGFYEIEPDSVREERARVTQIKAAKKAKNVGRMVNVMMLGMGGLLVLVIGWFILALLDISDEPQSPGEKACSDLGGRSSINGDRCTF